MRKLGFLGAGNMGGALIRGLIEFNAIEAENVYVCGHHPEKLKAFSEELGFHVSETLEEMVIYKALYGDGGIWVRPVSMWSETVIKDGVGYKRFTYIGE